MRRSPLLSGSIYIFLGCLFTFIAIQNIQAENTWGIMTYLLILMATFDIGSGLRMIALHFKLKSINSKK